MLKLRRQRARRNIPSDPLVDAIGAAKYPMNQPIDIDAAQPELRLEQVELGVGDQNAVGTIITNGPVSTSF